MTSTLRINLLAVAGITALALAGCSSTSTSGGESASPSPSDPGQCLLGSWAVDTSQFADSADDVIDAAAGGKVEGDIGIGFNGTQFTTSYNAVYTAKQPGGSATIDDLRVEMRGGSTANYLVGAATISLSGGNNAVVLTATTTSNGVVRKVKDIRPYLPLTNFSQGTVAYSCNNTSLLLTNQDGMVLTATRKG